MPGPCPFVQLERRFRRRPAIEVPDDRNRDCIRGPDAEETPVTVRGEMGAEPLVQPEVGAFIKEAGVLFAESIFRHAGTRTFTIIPFLRELTRAERGERLSGWR